ncbi:MAG: galactonate dehydratase [Acidobacteria bacterium]|nr:galactonate dehydratase [Acidobacteriota bacterium]
MAKQGRREFLTRAAAAGLGLVAASRSERVFGAKSGLKVARLETLRADRFTYVKVHTDGGVTGIGELHPASNTSGTVVTPIAAVKYCEEYLIGQDPTHIERHWQHMFRRNIFRGGSDAMAAVGAIDMALWDIAGKLAALPVHKLLGGPTREKVRLYVHVGGNSPEEVADQARRRVEQGFTAVRLYPLGDREKFADMSYQGIAHLAELYVAAVRKAVGPEVDVMIDVVCLLTPAEAIAVGKALAPYGLYFFEDPIEPDNIDALAHVAANLPMPVATGERLYTIYQFREVLNKNAAAYLRPDLCLAGGITGSKKIAALAEASYVGLVPHNPLSCVLTAACVQLCAAIHNLAIQEYPGDELEKPKRDLVKEPLKLEGGYLIVPQKPGLGVELNEEAFNHYPPVPYQRRAIVGRDGALRDY